MILVTGATGNQGGAVADHLLRNGQSIRILTRRPEQEKAMALAVKGAEICKGDLNDKDSVRKAMTGVEGVFSIQNFWDGLPDTFLGYEGEVRQGKMVADLAKELGVKQLIQTSAAGSDMNTGIHHFESKLEIESYIKNLGIPYTIFRPVFFMEHFKGRGYPGFQPRFHKGFLRAAIPAGKGLQVIAVTDIGAIVAKAFEQPKNFVNQTFDIAGDEITMPEAVGIISKILDKEIVFEEQPLSEVKGGQMVAMARFFSEKGYQADLALFGNKGLVSTSFFDWAKEKLKNYDPDERSY